MARGEDEDPKAIGDVGELAFATWARQVSITANKVQNDEHGWDYLLEFSRARFAQGGISLDLVPCELRSFVQVKTIGRSDRRVRINLANWRRMVRDSNPWFIAIVVVDDEHEPVDAFLVHIGEEWCNRVLRRLRESQRRKGTAYITITLRSHGSMRNAC